jgi:hypothetical protein
LKSTSLILFLVFQLSILTYGQPFQEVAFSKGILHNYGESGFFGGGVSFVDFDGDGWDDITFSSTLNAPLFIFRNVGSTFQSVTLPGISNNLETKCLLWVDFDNDGHKDLFVTSYFGNNRLYRNNGDLTFTDITLVAGLPLLSEPTFGATFADFNNDGWLDLYVANRPLENEYPSCNHLYVNNQNGSFDEITWTAGVADSLKGPLLTGALDLDMDGFQDLMVPQDKFYGNTVFRNNGDLTFEDASEVSGANFYMDAMSIAIGDFDNDHDLDVYITNTIQSNVLMENLGNFQFTNSAATHGLGFFGMSWGANFFDFDNDLDLDLYVSGENHDGLNPGFSRIYVNENFGFTTGNQIFLPGDVMRSFGNAIGDFNNDGYPDIATVTGFFGLSHLWQNYGGNNHWVKIDLQGVISNRDAIGSLLEFYVGGTKYIRTTHSSVSYNSQNSNVVLFGMGMNQVLDSLHVRWPSGIVTKHNNLQSNQRYLLIEDFTTAITPAVDNFNVWPNPVSSFLSVSHSGADYLQMFNNAGQLVLSKRTSPQKGTEIFDMSSFEPGVYLLRVVKIGESISTVRIVR